MSYDLMVFDPTVAPSERSEFMLWYKEITKWQEKRDYNSPEGLTGNLNDFYVRFCKKFPPMNGPNAFDFNKPKSVGLLENVFGKRLAKYLKGGEVDERFVTDYAIAQSAIYLCFSWSIAEDAYRNVIDTAFKAKVGFFDVSANNGDIFHHPDQFRAVLKR